MTKRYMDEDRQEYFEERAAIREYDGGSQRHIAERLAEMDVLKKFGAEDNGDGNKTILD